MSLHAIGGQCAVVTCLPPREGAQASYTTDTVIGNGLTATFNEVVHCLATEPRETVLKVAVMDGELEVAYEMVVLDTLRGGYRCLSLRSPVGTRIRLCSLLLHISQVEEPNTMSHAACAEALACQVAEQAERLAAQDALLEEQRHTIAHLQQLLQAEAQRGFAGRFLKRETS
jgi:hypothetical protein